MARAKKAAKKTDSPVASSASIAKKGVDTKPIAGTKKNIKIGDKKKSKSKPVVSLHRYVHLVLKQVHPECRMSKKTMSIMNSMMFDIMEKVAIEASKLCKIGKSKTLSSRDIQTSTRLIFPGDLAKHAISEGTKAINKYMLSKASSRKTTTPRPEYISE